MENRDKANVWLIPELKKRLVEAKDFSDVWNYFFDNFGENEAFMALGKPALCPQLEAILKQAGANAFKGEEVKIHSTSFFFFEEQAFLHGAYTINGKFAGVLYFLDLQIGLAGITLSMAGPTEFCRFRTGKITGIKTPHRN